MSAHSTFIELDLYGRALDFVSGKGAEREGHRQACLKTKLCDKKHAKHVKRSVVYVDDYVDLDLYGRGEPCVSLPGTGLPSTSTSAGSRCVLSSKSSPPKSTPVATELTCAEASSNLGSHTPEPSAAPPSLSQTSGAAVPRLAHSPTPSGSPSPSCGHARGRDVRQGSAPFPASSRDSSGSLTRSFSQYAGNGLKGSGGKGMIAPRASSSPTSSRACSPSGYGQAGSPLESAPGSCGTTGTNLPRPSSQASHRSRVSGKGKNFFGRSARRLKWFFRSPSSSQTPSTSGGGSPTLSGMKTSSDDPTGRGTECHFSADVEEFMDQDLDYIKSKKSGNVKRVTFCIPESVEIPS